MKINHWITGALFTGLVFGACQNPQEAQLPQEVENTEEKSEFVWSPDRFADLKIVRYQVPSFDKLSLNQKKLVYFLSQAALSGRDMIWDQNYRHNLRIRRTLEAVVSGDHGDKSGEDWAKFMEYTKRVWFSSGIHHHYSSMKFEPEFSREFFVEAVMKTSTELPLLVGETKEQLAENIADIIFDMSKDIKRVNLASGADIVLESANNYYGEDVTQAEAESFYQKMKQEAGKTNEPISYGLNSKLVKKNGKIREQVWKLGGMYNDAIEQVIFWLDKAVGVAENEQQAKGLKLLIDYYKTGDLKIWDDYNIAWVGDTLSDIDYINGFIEVYGDAKGYKASYESVVQIKDFDASAAMQVLSENAQWFEDHSTIMEEHKRPNVKGVSYKVIEAAMESGDASPSTPIGINLPNANWIRANHGSKSVSLGNIVYAYSQAGGKGLLNEFCLNKKEIERSEAHAKRAAKLHTAMHEVIGHASGKINPGIGTPKETLKNYSSALEEGRADLVALYYLMDQKLIDLGLMESLEIGKAEYDGYIRNGLLTQLQRIEPGADIEEAHMRNRQMIAKWVYEKGKPENVIEKVQKSGKTYFKITDYNKLRALFGELLKEIQRIKSEGDYEAGKNLIENYGVKVDVAMHKEVLERVEKLNIAPYGGFINPKYMVTEDKDGNITDVKITYPDDFQAQMMEYAKEYSFLPHVN